MPRDEFQRVLLGESENYCLVLLLYFKKNVSSRIRSWEITEDGSDCWAKSRKVDRCSNITQSISSKGEIEMSFKPMIFLQTRACMPCKTGDIEFTSPSYPNDQAAALFFVSA